MTLAAWLHDLDPFLFRISGDFGIRWYGLSYALGFFLAYLLLRWMSRRGMTLIPVHRVGDVVIAGALGGVIGGRLGYVIAYQPSLFGQFTPSFPWWGVLDLMHGGMASHGGFIGAVIAAWHISRRYGPAERGGRMPMLHVTDTMALVTPTGLMLGRLANFVNGELLGRIVAAPGQDSPWWSVKFPQELLGESPPVLSPAQAAELDRLIGQAALPGDGPGAPIQRLIEQVQHGAPGVAERLEPLLAARVPSQLVQAAAEGIVLGAVLWWVARRPRTTGVVSAWFLIAYGVLRIVTEIWRLPDAQFAVGRPMGLSRGQWFSAGMVAVGAGLLWLSVRKGGERLGGWARPAAAKGNDG